MQKNLSKKGIPQGIYFLVIIHRHRLYSLFLLLGTKKKKKTHFWGFALETKVKLGMEWGIRIITHSLKVDWMRMLLNENERFFNVLKVSALLSKVLVGLFFMYRCKKKQGRKCNLLFPFFFFFCFFAMYFWGCFLHIIKMLTCIWVKMDNGRPASAHVTKQVQISSPALQIIVFFCRSFLTSKIYFSINVFWCFPSSK